MDTRDPRDRPTPDAVLELLRQGELPAAAADRLEAVLDEADRARLAALDADDAAILRRHPPARVAAEIERRLAAAPRPAPARRLLFALPAAAAVAAALLLLLRPAPELPTHGREAIGTLAPTDRAKGDAALLVFRATRDGVRQLLPHDRARAGDLLQLGMRLPHDAHAVLVSIDGAGAVTRHHPVGGADTATPAGRTVLGRSYQLDAAPGFERFVLVTAATPIDVDAVLNAARALAAAPTAETAPLRLGAGLDQTSFLLTKDGDDR